jgi:hypothetical protein
VRLKLITRAMAAGISTEIAKSSRAGARKPQALALPAAEPAGNRVDWGSGIKPLWAVGIEWCRHRFHRRPAHRLGTGWAPMSIGLELYGSLP